ncbi:MAG: FecR domain-containing protein [Tannerellaceae bacterium]|jgi:ferric-dicitrate binding protein FerR (iron transport regulator)|nr:FecR domain-containing protein [Tannerellaceae bacterium]
MSAKLYGLLNRYISGKASNEELKKLKILVGITDEEMLSEHLNQLWIEFEMQEKPSGTVIREIYKNIEQVHKPPMVYRKPGWFLRIAVVFLILLLSGLSTYLYITRENGILPHNRQMVVQTERGQQATIFLPDSSKVRLNVESSLQYKQNYGHSNRQVNLSGEAFFEIVKDEQKPFIVQTEYLDIEVLGTSFNVYSYNYEETVEMALISGKIKITPRSQPENITYLKPNEKLFYNKHSGKIKVEKTDNRFETAWLRGALVFRSIPVKDVLKKIERKYGVTIHLNIPAVENDKFTGSIESDYITEVMQIFQTHYSFRYKIEGDNIYISSK